MATKHGKTLKQIHDTELSVTRGQSTLFNGIKKYYSIVVGPRKKFLGFFFIFIFFEVVVVWGKGSFSKTNDCIPSIDFIKRSLIWWLKKQLKKNPETLPSLERMILLWPSFNNKSCISDWLRKTLLLTVALTVS